MARLTRSGWGLALCLSLLLTGCATHLDRNGETTSRHDGAPADYAVERLGGGLPSDLFKFDDGRLVVEFFGSTRAERPDAYRLASPITHVDADTPPHFLFQGRWDSLVPVDHATDFHAELLAQGVESELYLQHYRGHVTSFLTRDSAIEAGIAFLDRQMQ
ncbi:MAG: prolyl oligopeptidase family serine peptidase [Halomonas sp.]|uniref:prolyl oligopeptidase family serine peptidase n=1 Tax=Halomonas sp. TaxID=1486246 RepID=UPI002870001A|nr:prolyl oligopeptidase family serine peptidase [Halomonas sp.]MDR9439908.1 prolyl oligopeptidase family serine peptidase [Halomonas sp.]